jgi:hypothetical protein
MSLRLLKNLAFVILLGACASASRTNKQAIQSFPADELEAAQPTIGSDIKIQSLTDLAQTEDGGFVLKPGFYETEYKTYCLEPGTPDPRPGDAYLQGPITGNRKDIVESVLLKSRTKPHIEQRNVQLLLWNIVSGSDFNKLPIAVQADANELLTSKQIFKLKGGVAGYIKEVSSSTGAFSTNSGINNLFNLGVSSYESYERLAVSREPSKIKKTGVKADQWYKEKENYYVRYLPLSYQKVKIQLYIPDSLLDAEGKLAGEYVVYNPTGLQAMPAFTNAQRLGIGAPVVDIVKEIIRINKGNGKPKTPPTPKPSNPKSGNPKGVS